MLVSRIVEDRQALFLTIDNFGAIAMAFGDDVASIITDQVRHCAYALSKGEFELHPLSPSILTIDRGDADTGASLVALDELCTQISMTPFLVKGFLVLVTVSLHEDVAQAHRACTQAPPFAGEWTARYRNDMSVAANFVKQVAEDALITLWRPVRSTQMPDVVLHYEAVPQLFALDGRHRDCSAEYEALQRLGMAWIHDRAMLLHAIEQLYADARPCIAVRLSPQSFQTVDEGRCGHWLAALQRLEARPDVAARLVIEISETAGGTVIDSMKDQIGLFKQLGVSLSVANFASSDINFGALITLDPDIVKISPVFLQGAVVNPASCRRLQLLFKLAATLSRTVVVEGVDGDRHMQIARVLGAEWVKGYSVGEPAFARHWKIAASAGRRHVVAVEPANSDFSADDPELARYS